MPLKQDQGLSKLSDEELISVFQGGENEAYTEIVNRYKDRLTNFIFRYAGNYDECEDIVQETMIKLYMSKHLYKQVAKFSTWLYTIAINIAKTKLQKKQRYRILSLSTMFENEERTFDIPDEAFGPDTNTESKIQDEIIQKALNCISENYRKLIILRDIEDFSYEEISQITGLPMGTVKSRINRGREKLQHLLKDIYKEINV